MITINTLPYLDRITTWQEGVGIVSVDEPQTEHDKLLSSQRIKWHQKSGRLVSIQVHVVVAPPAVGGDE